MCTFLTCQIKYKYVCCCLAPHFKTLEISHDVLRILKKQHSLEMASLGVPLPGWKVCQLCTECQETDKILRTKIEINVRSKIRIEIARDDPLPIFNNNVV